MMEKLKVLNCSISRKMSRHVKNSINVVARSVDANLLLTDIFYTVDLHDALQIKEYYVFSFRSTRTNDRIVSLVQAGLYGHRGAVRKLNYDENFRGRVLNNIERAIKESVRKI